MLQITTDPSMVREWAESRGARPALTGNGRLALALPGDRPFASIGWEEFAGHFTVEGMAFLFDLRPGSTFHRFGREQDLRELVEPAPAAPGWD